VDQRAYHVLIARAPGRVVLADEKSTMIALVSSHRNNRGHRWEYRVRLLPGLSLALGFSGSTGGSSAGKRVRIRRNGQALEAIDRPR
jgi:hypothetical protein